MGVWLETLLGDDIPRETCPHHRATMDKINSEEFKENSAKSETGFSLMNLVMGIVMVAIGYQNLPGEVAEGEAAAADPCPNGAAYWLYVAGICLLVSNSINTWAKIYKKCAERDGKIWATWTENLDEYNANMDE